MCELLQRSYLVPEYITSRRSRCAHCPEQGGMQQHGSTVESAPRDNTYLAYSNKYTNKSKDPPISNHRVHREKSTCLHGLERAWALLHALLPLSRVRELVERNLRKKILLPQAPQPEHVVHDFSPERQRLQQQKKQKSTGTSESTSLESRSAVCRAIWRRNDCTF